MATFLTAGTPRRILLHLCRDGAARGRLGEHLMLLYVLPFRRWRDQHLLNFGLFRTHEVLLLACFQSKLHITARSAVSCVIESLLMHLVGFFLRHYIIISCTMVSTDDKAPFFYDVQDIRSVAGGHQRLLLSRRCTSLGVRLHGHAG